MKKVILGLLFSVILTGCSNNDKEPSVDISFSSEESTTTSSSIQEYVAFQVFRPTYSLDDNSLTISGTATSGSEVVVLENETELASTESLNGKFTIHLPLPKSNEDEVAYTVRIEDATEVIPVRTKSYLEALANKKNDEKSTTSKSSTLPSSSSEEKPSSSSESKLLDYQIEGIENANTNPAKPGVMLYDKSETYFKGMNYFFEGEIIGTTTLENVTSGNAWLVKNTNGYVMPIEYYNFSAVQGDSIKVWGTLSGLGYASSDLGVDNVVGVAGSMHALSVEINGKIAY
jgi:hypothetical protein